MLYVVVATCHAYNSKTTLTVFKVSNSLVILQKYLTGWIPSRLQIKRKQLDSKTNISKKQCTDKQVPRRQKMASCDMETPLSSGASSMMSVRKRIPSKENPPPKLGTWLDTFQVIFDRIFTPSCSAADNNFPHVSRIFTSFPELVKCGTANGAWPADRVVRTNSSAAYDGRHRAAVSTRLHLPAAKGGASLLPIFGFYRFLIIFCSNLGRKLTHFKVQILGWVQYGKPCWMPKGVLPLHGRSPVAYSRLEISGITLRVKNHILRCIAEKRIAVL